MRHRDVAWPQLFDGNFATFGQDACSRGEAGGRGQPHFRADACVGDFQHGLPADTSLTSWTPNSNNILQVQVIGQQWAWTYRYPQFGGFETTQLELPVGEPVQFNVTSLDVIHGFWAYQLGVKADANPGVNNVAYTTPKHTGSFVVRCDELCGLWHGAMFDYGKVVSVSAFNTWAQQTQVQLASVTKILPPYAMTYDPTDIASLGKVLTQLGIGGAGGGYYSPNDPEQP